MNKIIELINRIRGVNEERLQDIVDLYRSRCLKAENKLKEYKENKGAKKH